MRRLLACGLAALAAALLAAPLASAAPKYVRPPVAPTVKTACSGWTEVGSTALQARVCITSRPLSGVVTPWVSIIAVRPYFGPVNVDLLVATSSDRIRETQDGGCSVFNLTARRVFSCIGRNDTEPPGTGEVWTVAYVNGNRLLSTGLPG